MKKTVFIILLFFILSCNKEYEKLELFEINGNEIKIYNNMFDFSDFEHFYKVVSDYYNNQEEYVAYFEKFKPIQNNEIYYTEVLKSISKIPNNPSDEFFHDLKSKYKFVRIENGYILPLFDMDYKNMFCNFQGFIRIGDFTYKYDNKGRFKCDNNNFNGFISEEESSFEQLSLNDQPSDIQNRSDLAGSCINEFENRRIKCIANIDFDKSSNMDCNNENYKIIAEAKSTFQKFKFRIPFTRKADSLSIDINYQILNENGNTEIYVNDHRESLKKKHTKWGKVSTFCVDCSKNYDFGDYVFNFYGLDDGDFYACDISINTDRIRDKLCK